MPIVYQILNKLNSKSYVGVTRRTTKQRLHEHSRANTVIGSAIRAHGKENFEIKVLHESDSEGECYSLEQQFIDNLGSHVSKHGYNVEEGGKKPPSVPRHQSEEERRERSRRMAGNQYAKGGKSKRGQSLSDETKAKISRTKKASPYVFTDEQRRKISETSRGRKFSAESKEKKSHSMKGKKNALGATRSDETRRRMSEARKAYWAAKRQET